MTPFTELFIESNFFATVALGIGESDVAYKGQRGCAQNDFWRTNHGILDDYE